MVAPKQRSLHPCSCATCRDHSRSATAQEHRAINQMLLVLDEKSRRRFVGLLALQWGRGGMSRLAQITGLSRTTIRQGRNEVQRIEQPAESDRVRKAGGGRRRVEKNSQRL